MRRFVCTLSLVAAACSGQVLPGGSGNTPAPSASGQEPSQPDQPANTPGSVAPTERAFAPLAGRAALLPFGVRLTKLAAIAGVAETDALLESVVQRKLDLGAHDFGANIAPDLQWSAQRMVAWIQAVAPICDNAKFKSRYANWKTALPQFARAAWGRNSTDGDQAALDAALTEVNFANDDSKWRATCLALLSSSELVTQ